MPYVQLVLGHTAKSTRLAGCGWKRKTNLEDCFLAIPLDPRTPRFINLHLARNAIQTARQATYSAAKIWTIDVVTALQMLLSTLARKAANVLRRSLTSGQLTMQAAGQSIFQRTFSQSSGKAARAETEDALARTTMDIAARFMVMVVSGGGCECKSVKC